MERIADPLRRMGAAISTADGRAPLVIRGGRNLSGIDFALPVASAQIKSALLLAGLHAKGYTTLRSPGPSRDHTERMLQSMGAAIETDANTHRVRLTRPERLEPGHIDIPGDFSSAAFFIVAACIAGHAGLLIDNVGINPTRTGLVTILRAMGANIELRNEREVGREPVADIYVERSQLSGIEVPAGLVPLAIDEFPVLFVAAAAARGRTVIDGAAELRHKESDRIAVMARALEALGARVDERPAGLAIEGGRLAGGAVDSAGDHRVAMSLAIASLIAETPIEIENTAQVATSFPGFVATARAVGLDVGPPAG